MTQVINQGTVDFNCEVYTDQMCLKQMRNMRTETTGTFCLKQHPMLVAYSIVGEFEANGVVGLAPGDGDNSVIE